MGNSAGVQVMKRVERGMMVEKSASAWKDGFEQRRGPVEYKLGRGAGAVVGLQQGGIGMNLQRTILNRQF